MRTEFALSTEFDDRYEGQDPSELELTGQLERDPRQMATDGMARAVKSVIADRKAALRAYNASRGPKHAKPNTGSNRLHAKPGAGGIRRSGKNGVLAALGTPGSATRRWRSVKEAQNITFRIADDPNAASKTFEQRQELRDRTNGEMRRLSDAASQARGTEAMRAAYDRRDKFMQMAATPGAVGAHFNAVDTQAATANVPAAPAAPVAPPAPGPTN